MINAKQNNAAINWQISGTEDIVVFLVHGAFIDQSYREKQVAYFSKKYTVVTTDLAGHGKSGKERIQWTVENSANEVNFLME